MSGDGNADVDVTAWEKNDQAGFTSLFAFANKTHAVVFLPALLVTILAGVAKPTITILLGFIFDDLVSFGVGDTSQMELLHKVSIWCIALTGIGIATILANGAFFSLWLVFGELQAKGVRNSEFVAMLEKEIEWYDLQVDGIGSILVRLQTQIRELQMATSQPLGFLVEDIIASLAALSIAFYYSWNLTAVLLACVPVTLVVLALVSRKVQPAIEIQKAELTEASKYSHIAITGIDTVKIFNAQDHEIWQYASAIERAAKGYMTQANTNSLQLGITRFMTTGMFVVGFWYGMVLVKQGLSPGNVLTTFYACLMATQAAECLLPQWLVLSKGMSAGENLKGILMQLEGGQPASKMIGLLKPAMCHGEIEISNLMFAYPSNPDQAVIRNASFFFPAGETTFVVGRSGSGKSTLGNLLLKFYPPLSGQIWIDGHSLQNLDLNWLRNNVSLVQQDSVLFNETIFRNIAFGQPRHMLVTRRSVRSACQVAMLQETINNLPNGINTMIGPCGSLLSGGQRQRIAIARARLRDAPILILDEATSALDFTGKSLVMDAIRSWRRGKTTIIITHDISEIREKDYVYVLDDGNVVHEGYPSQIRKDRNWGVSSFLPDHTRASLNGEAVHLADTSSASTASEEPRNHLTNCMWPLESEAGWLRQNLESHLLRVPKLFGLDEGIYGLARSSQTVPHRVGMASVYANTLPVESVYGRASLVRDSMPALSLPKPLPALPLDWNMRGSYQGEHGDSNTYSTREVLEAMGEKLLQTQPGTVKCKISSPKHALKYHTTSLKSVKMLEQKPLTRQTRVLEKPVQAPNVSLTQILGTVWPNLLWRDRFILLLGFIFALLSAASVSAFSYVLAKLLGTFSMDSGQLGEAKKWALTILGIATVDGISTYYMHYLLEYCGQVWVDKLRVEALKRILAQPRAWFDQEKNKPGRLNECLDRNAEEMRNLVGRFAGYIFLAVSMMIIAIVWAFIICWKLSLVGLASGPCMYAFTRAFEDVSGNWEKKLNRMTEITGNIFYETFLNIKAVRALMLENHFKEMHSKATVKAYRVGLQRAAYTGLFFGLSDSTNSFVIALILYYGAVITASGDWSANDVLLVITLLLFSSGNANSVLAFIPQVSSSRTTATDLLWLANLPMKASHESIGTKYLASPLPIHLNSLSFTYPSRPGVEILHNISMTFEPGSCTAIVGSSGSGKSTIASLLLGIYPSSEPLHGSHPSLTFANTSIFDYNITSLRNRVSLVTQQPMLFPCTVFENISYGLSPLSDLRNIFNIQSAAREAGIHEFVSSLPHGYGTKVGDGGQGLSGGQAQRIGIARALARRPKILVLDEPTSALDYESAEVVRRMMKGFVTGDRRGLRNGREEEKAAVIVITHSLEMMKVADRVIVLDQGRVVEEGGFNELLRRGGPFARLVSGGDLQGGLLA